MREHLHEKVAENKDVQFLLESYRNAVSWYLVLNGVAKIL